mmetsp:Transcript_1770/g.4201  ORF Transcript_1770/g.4201 Transcript_1770/m.4201 type:complete len:348 (-) Transcript_1770:85-1128(-)
MGLGRGEPPQFRRHEAAMRKQEQLEWCGNWDRGDVAWRVFMLLFELVATVEILVALRLQTFAGLDESVRVPLFIALQVFVIADELALSAVAFFAAKRMSAVTAAWCATALLVFDVAFVTIIAIAYALSDAGPSRTEPTAILGGTVACALTNLVLHVCFVLAAYAGKVKTPTYNHSNARSPMDILELASDSPSPFVRLCVRCLPRRTSTPAHMAQMEMAAMPFIVNVTFAIGLLLPAFVGVALASNSYGLDAALVLLFFLIDSALIWAPAGANLPTYGFVCATCLCATAGPVVIIAVTSADLGAPGRATDPTDRALMIATVTLSCVGLACCVLIGACATCHGPLLLDE